MYCKKGELNPRYNQKASKETREKLSKTVKEQYKNGRIPNRTGKQWDETTKEKMSKSHKGKIDGKNNPNYGKGLNKGKPVCCLETGQIFESISKAAKEYNCWPHQIRACCNGERETAGNMHWQFVSQANTVPSEQEAV